MATKLNTECLSHALHLAQTGQVGYGKWNADSVGRSEKNKLRFLAVDDSMKPEDAGYWKYPIVGNDGKLNRKAVASSQGYADKNGEGAVTEACRKIAAVLDKVPDQKGLIIPSMEVRFFKTEFRMEQDSNGSPVLVGRAACYNSLSEPLPFEDDETKTFREIIMPGAFTRTLSENPDVRLLINHEGLPLGRTTSGTLQLSEDENAGLMCRTSLDLTNPRAQELASAIKRGDCTSMSFGFRCIEQSNRVSDDGEHIRELRDCELHDGDVSAVTYPAYKATNIALRSLRSAHISYKDFAPEKRGMSIAMASRIIALSEI